MQTLPKLDTVFRQFHTRLKRFILTKVSDEDTADDILQDVFLKVHAKIDELKDVSKLESWLYQITRNAIIDYYRTKKQSHSLPAEIIEEETTETPVQKLSVGINTFINQLPEEYRTAIIMSEIEGITQAEVAKRLGISVSGAKSRVQRGRKKLKELLFECCHFEFDKFGAVIDYYPHPPSPSCCPVCKEN